MELIGMTERAKSIRSEIIAQCETVIDISETKRDQLDEVGVAITELCERLIAQTRSSWWISNSRMLSNGLQNYIRESTGLLTSKSAAANKINQLCR